MCSIYLEFLIMLSLCVYYDLYGSTLLLARCEIYTIKVWTESNHFQPLMPVAALAERPSNSAQSSAMWRPTTTPKGSLTWWSRRSWREESTTWRHFRVTATSRWRFAWGRNLTWFTAATSSTGFTARKSGFCSLRFRIFKHYKFDQRSIGQWLWLSW